MRFNLQQRLQSLRMVASLSAFLRHPGDLDSVFAVARSLQGSPLATQMQRHLLADPTMAALVAEGWRPAPIALEQLATLPEGSLGRTHAQQLQRLGLTPESLLDPRPITSPAGYLTHRLRETHDIVHVLTGFGIDGTGELGLQDDEPLEPLLHALSRGFEMGLAASCLISVRLEEGWERLLADWRRELGLPASLELSPLS